LVSEIDGASIAAFLTFSVLLSSSVVIFLMAKYIDQAVNAIIRPPRKTYDPTDIPLFLEGPDKRTYVRHPVNISNERSQRVVGSIYVDITHDLMDGGPCLVYMHGNASSQHEGQFLIPNLCPLGIAVYCFDFAGCGASDGDVISLGHFETLDVEFIINNLMFAYNLGPFVLWGRSMGAATALLVDHPKVVGKVVDSSYTSIPDVIMAIARKLKMPSIFYPAALWFLKTTIIGRADFDLSTVSPLRKSQEPGTVPVLICHAADDQFIPIEQGEQIFAAYSNPDKVFIRITGGHNGRRPLDVIDQSCKFAMRMLGVSMVGFGAVRFIGIHDTDQHFKSYDDLLKFMNQHGTEDRNIDSPICEGMIAATKSGEFTVDATTDAG
jgi:pimeloyl-ACP methyl ester carboxylesterase